MAVRVMIVLVAILAAVATAGSSSSKTGGVTNSNGECETQVIYSKPVTVSYRRAYTVSTTHFCFSWTFRCAKDVTKYAIAYKTEQKRMSKTEKTCCDGYFRSDYNVCKPICHSDCHEGFCGAPNRCVCNAGWGGKNCDEPCVEGTYGSGCALICQCVHGECSTINGYCTCPAGFTGQFCEEICPTGFYGTGCGNLCLCNSAHICDPITGVCSCPTGYAGNLCDVKCPNETNGTSCLDVCNCNNETTQHCNPETGECYCQPGYKGTYCEEQCESPTWGPECEYTCPCDPDIKCHHVTGRCICKPGLMGHNCLKGCSPGTFGQSCENICPECENAENPCDPATGQCHCLSGYIGSLCEMTCPLGYYGVGCRNKCVCENEGSCDPTSGHCSCTPGWTEIDCSIACPSGTYGQDCLSPCKCMNNATCNPKNGICTCAPGWMGHNCNTTCMYDYYGPLCTKVCHCTKGQICDHIDGSCKDPETIFWTKEKYPIMGFCLLLCVSLAISLCMYLLYLRRSKIQERKDALALRAKGFDNPIYMKPKDSLIRQNDSDSASNDLFQLDQLQEREILDRENTYQINLNFEMHDLPKLPSPSLPFTGRIASDSELIKCRNKNINLGDEASNIDNESIYTSIDELERVRHDKEDAESDVSLEIYSPISEASVYDTPKKLNTENSNGTVEKELE